MNDYLDGRDTDLSGVPSTPAAALDQRPVAAGGNNVHHDAQHPEAQRTAMSELAASGYKGAVAALDPAQTATCWRWHS